MAIARLDYTLKDYELAAYELSKIYINKGFMTNVIVENGGYSTYIYQKNYIASPVSIKVSFRNNDGKAEIEVKGCTNKIDTENVVRESIAILTILPISVKGVRFIKLKDTIKKDAIKVAEKYRKE